MPHDILRQSGLGRGLTDDELDRFVEAVRPVSFKSGEVICRQNQPGDSMFIVARGRLEVAVARDGSEYRLIDHLGRGDHFGEMAMLTDGRRSATVRAVMDSELYELPQDAFQELLSTVPTLAGNLCRTLGYLLRWETQRRSRRTHSSVVGIVHTTSTRELTGVVARALATAGEGIHVLSDADKRQTNEEIPWEGIATPEEAGDVVRVIHDRLTEVLPQRDRVLMDLAAGGLDEELPSVLAQCEQIWWIVDPEMVEPSLERLESLLERNRNLASRVHLVWSLYRADRFAPPIPSRFIGLRERIQEREFKLIVNDVDGLGGLHQQQSVARIVHHLQGRRIGLALGGGGARGLAHLGVLRALERAGIFVDSIVGTSVGALMGLSYAAGRAADEAVSNFQHDLTPPWIFRKIPRGSYWYMLMKFRTGGWDPMLRAHVGDVRLEQLHIPLSTVAVDLIQGKVIVRNEGDAINSVLESINLPMVSRPIMRDGMALIDGGILNNVPVDVALDQGADVVIGVDVAADLSQTFAGNRAGMADEKMRQPRTLETMFRVNEVQDFATKSPVPSAADLMIAINTSDFAFADFTKARELADLGQKSTEKVMPLLKDIVAGN